jgi:uncharacterized membrane protein (UPF0127 family)
MKKLFIEIADTSIKREYGLMNRSYLPKNQGMLFKFHQPLFASFWMRDTYIPLDIAFLDDDGRVFQIESMTPLSTRAIYSDNKCKYALEVNRGWFSENNIKVGSRIDGEGIGNYKKTAQIISQLPPPVEGAVPGSPEPVIGGPIPGEPAPLPQPEPDVMLNLSYKERFKNAELKGQDILIIYQTKGGITLPPKMVSPPFNFEEDAEGHHDAVVKTWDNQTGGWKSFLIDNILSLEEQK